MFALKFQHLFECSDQRVDRLDLALAFGGGDAFADRRKLAFEIGEALLQEILEAPDGAARRFLAVLFLLFPPFGFGAGLELIERKLQPLADGGKARALPIGKPCGVPVVRGRRLVTVVCHLIAYFWRMPVCTLATVRCQGLFSDIVILI